MRLRLFQIIQRSQNNDQVSRWYDFFIVTVAFISIVPLMFKSEQVSPEIDLFLNILDIVTVYILFADYVFRWITYDIKSGLGKKAFLVYPFTPMAIIDLLSILPSITILHDGFKFLRILRIVRIVRMFNGLTIMTNVFIRERKALASIMFLLCVYVLTVGLIMFTIEPDTFNTFLDALYWSTTALATIGYGDITPISDFGKFIAIVSSLVGIAVVAFPAGIITGGYITQLQKARSKGHEYFAMPIKHDKIFKGKHITKYKSIKAYFKANKKVKYYLIWIFICLAISVITTIESQYNPYTLIYFDEYGSILASVILEPTAGFVVALINDVMFAIYTRSPYAILTFGCGAMYSIIFGVYFRRGRKINAKSILLAIVFLIFVNTVYILLVYLLAMPNTELTSLDLNYDNIVWLTSVWGMDIYSGIVFYYFFGRVVYAIFAFLSVVLIRQFFWGSRIDPMLKIPVRKRYKMKLYKRGKNEHSYIQDWLEQNSDEDEDIPEFAAAVEMGKKSIEQSRKSIEEKKESIEEMRNEVYEKIGEIRKQEEEIAKHAKAIDVKKRAVRKVRRRQRITESDSAISNIAESVIAPSITDKEIPGSDTVGQTDSFEPVKSDNKNNGNSAENAKHKKQ